MGKDVHNQCACFCESVCTPNTGCVDEVNCVAHTKTYDSLISMWSSILCSKDENAKFHNKGYIMGECNMCGIQLLKVCPT
jgi:hypothetical protein